MISTASPIIWEFPIKLINHITEVIYGIINIHISHSIETIYLLTYFYIQKYISSHKAITSVSIIIVLFLFLCCVPERYSSISKH